MNLKLCSLDIPLLWISISKAEKYFPMMYGMAVFIECQFGLNVLLNCDNKSLFVYPRYTFALNPYTLRLKNASS